MQFFQGRRLRYEIYVSIGGRWRIEKIIDDERDTRGRFDRLDFEETERNAIGHANSLLASGKFEAVRVLRERRRDDGFATSSEIFRREAANEREAPVSIGRLEEPVGLCAKPPDLARPAACRVIGTLLRGYLDRHVLSPLELLHHAPYIRKLNDNNSLVQAAISQVAARQSHGTSKERVALLQRIVDGAERRARDAMAERRLPMVEDSDLRRLAARIEARYGEAERDFFLGAALARWLQGLPSFQAKLARMLELDAETLAPKLVEIVDQWAAGFVESPMLITDLLGRQKNLAAALVALVELANGRFAALGEAAAVAAALGAGLRAGKYPLVAQAIWDRLVRELRRGRPLCRDDSGREWSTLMQLSDKLPQSAPPPWADQIRDALKSRVRRLQEADVA